METSVACAPLCPPAVKLQVKKTFLLRYIGGKLQNPSHGIEIIGFIFSGRKCQINPLKKHSGSEEPTALSKSHPECGRGEARGGFHPQVALHHHVSFIIALWGSCNGEIRLGICNFQDHFQKKCHFHFLIH